MLNIAELDKRLRKGDVEGILDANDKILLATGLGISKRDISALRQIWKKLRDRRIGRNHA